MRAVSGDFFCAMTLFEPYRIHALELRNRWVLPPMCMYSATDGQANDFHEVHYATRAMGGVGLVVIEATGVLPNGRITDRCLGLWKDEQIRPFRRIVDACHRHGACVAAQLAHAGRKCVAAGVGRVVAPSALRFSDASEYRDPHALTSLEMETLLEAFASAAARAASAGVDAIEIHGAHGYLIHQFLSPLSNHRKDAYGGTPENRSRFLLEVVRAVRREWPAPKPLMLRVSATDYTPGGLTPEDLVGMINRVRTEIDLLHVSSGGLLPIEIFQTPGYQVAYAETLRRACRLPVIAVGLITSAEQAEAILQANRADLVAMGRELLRNPFLPLNSARRLGVPAPVPRQYLRAFESPMGESRVLHQQQPTTRKEAS
jgi:NADPH2 dehydrogenase